MIDLLMRSSHIHSESIARTHGKRTKATLEAMAEAAEAGSSVGALPLCVMTSLGDTPSANGTL